MKAQKWKILAVLGWLGCFGISFSLAQAGVILPVDPVTRLPIAGSLVTVSVFQGGIDVTDTWLPEPGQTVQIVVNGLSSPIINLVFDLATAANPIVNTALTTSSYPGQCTNFNNPSPLAVNAPDFELNGNSLTPTDCGGMAVIQVNPGNLIFILPQDSDFDGMPDIWESRFGDLTANADIDTGPGSNPQVGDNISNFDEYRGFIVSGVHKRTNPNMKDLFVHLVNPQCLPTFADNTNPLSSTASLLGLGRTESQGRTIYPIPSAGALFDNLNTLGGQTHLLGHSPGRTNYTTEEWVDRFVAYSVQTLDTGTLIGPLLSSTTFSGFLYRDASGNLTKTPPLDDRQINVNAVHPRSDRITGPIQKGVRITECLDASVVSPLGIAGHGTPNASSTGRTETADNALLYTQRIINHFTTTADRNGDGVPDGLIPAGGLRKLRYSTFQSGAWTSAVTAPPDGSPTISPLSEASQFIISKSMQFYVAMEIGHDYQLTSTETVVRKVSYGYHFQPLSGDNLDQAITNKLDSKTTGFNTFYIPSLYGSTDLANFKVHN